MEKNYCSLGAEELFKKLDSSEKGLSSAEAKKKLSEYGFNEVSAKDKRTAIGILLSQLKSPLVLILIGASMIAGFLGSPLDALIILGIVLLNTALGFYQEFKSEKMLEELEKYVSFYAKAIRDGKKTEIDAKNLVPGDIVFVNIGDIVPADIRLLEADELLANESVVTGESFPVRKAADVIAGENIPVNEQRNMLFKGTTISSGSGKGIVVATGESTLFGKTANILGAKEPPTDFQKNMKIFGDFLVKIVAAMTIFVFAANYFLGRGMLESFLFALALAVGITPELLPAIITIGLSAGAMHLSKKKVIVKRLVSIEDLGNIDVLCIDKTGTLTENKVTLEKYCGTDLKKSADVLELAILCSPDADGETERGNVIDNAIWNYAKDNKISQRGWKKIEEIEFDYERRRMSVVVGRNTERLLVCKGSVESIISVCSKAKIGKNTLHIGHCKEELLEKAIAMENDGFRVIAIACGKTERKKDYSKADEKELVFMGFLAFIDPPKKTAIDSLKSFQSLGVELKILTGDSSQATTGVCREVGLAIKGRIVLGTELEGMNKEEFKAAIMENNVFARVTPEQKHLIVEGLSKARHIVGFLGDGVNDAPALKAADVGITVDSAADVAKGSADIILLKKNLMVIADGITTGRKTFGNMMKYIFNTISANFGNMFTLAISSLFLGFIPLLPSQILLANLISDGPLMTISTDNVDYDYLKKPKRWSIKAISDFMLFFGAISSLFDFITIGILLFVVQADAATFRTAWFLESVLSEIIVTFTIRTKRNFWDSKPSTVLIWSSVAAIILTVALIYSPLAFLFKFEHLAIPILAAIGAILLAYLLITEAAKKRFYRTHEL